ncbi:MAG TPA: hypothetical protein ENI87_08420 [bacterium]|nr:hypothetical protein [bacterium]
MLAIGRPALPGAESNLAIEAPARLPRPERLPELPRIRENGFATDRRHEVGERSLTVVLSSVPAVVDPGVAGIATFDSVTGGDFRWFPLVAGEDEDDGSLRMTVTTAVDGPLTITFAAAREHARHGYLSRRRLDADSDAAGAPITLAGETYRVRIDLPPGTDRAGPLRLQRVDDRQWLPMLHSTSGLTLRRGAELVLDLGAGTYELQDPIAPERSQRFDVPGTDRVEISAALAPARDGRQ